LRVRATLQGARECHYHRYQPDTHHDAHLKPFFEAVSNIRLPSQPDCFHNSDAPGRNAR
jgi:hypothetical protein